LIEFRNIGMRYASLSGSTQALTDISFTVGDGEFVTVLGPSGCGKSTLLFVATGLKKPTSGKVLINGEELKCPIKNVGFVFQDHLLLEWRTVLSNIMIQGEFRGMGKEECKDRAIKMINLVGLSGCEDKFPHELSGGMQQRVSICRAMMHDPDILMMDEPYGALDALTREQMRVDLEKLWIKQKSTVLFITHDINESILLSDRIVVMTLRPGTIKEIIVNKLPRPRSLRVTESPEFMEYRKHITDLFMNMGVLHEN